VKEKYYSLAEEKYYSLADKPWLISQIRPSEHATHAWERRGECTSPIEAQSPTVAVLTGLRRLAQVMARREKDDRVGGSVLESLPESSRRGLE